MEVGRIAVSTKGVEGGDQGAERGRVRDGERVLAQEGKRGMAAGS